MTDIAEQIRRQIYKKMAAGGQERENPLVAIGLSPAILNLGLNNEELWQYCRAASRFLVAHFHPDRHPTDEVAEEQRNYSAAFEALKDYGMFLQDLEEFRSDAIGARSEINSLKRTNRRLKESLQKTTAATAEQINAEREQRLAAEKALRELNDGLSHYFYYQGKRHRKTRGGMIEECGISECKLILALQVSHGILTPICESRSKSAGEPEIIEERAGKWTRVAKLFLNESRIPPEILDREYQLALWNIKEWFIQSGLTGGASQIVLKTVLLKVDRGSGLIPVQRQGKERLTGWFLGSLTPRCVSLSVRKPKEWYYAPHIYDYRDFQSILPRLNPLVQSHAILFCSFIGTVPEFGAAHSGERKRNRATTWFTANHYVVAIELVD